MSLASTVGVMVPWLRRTRRAADAALVVALAAGCAQDAGAHRAGGPDGRIGVVAAFYPLQFLAQRIGGDRVGVTNLVRPGAEPHDLELRPRQLAAIVDADLVLYLR